MRITGAVLDAIGSAPPYASSRPITVSELELAPPGRDEILVRIEAAGLCHSDLSVVDGSRCRPVPMLLGHEAAGIVEAVGGAVSTVTLGQRVVMTFLPRCGDCDGCRTNGVRPCVVGSAANEAGELLSGGSRLQRGPTPVHHHLGVSGFATYAVVDARSVVGVDSDIPPTVAALLGCAVLTGGGAVLNVAKPEAGQTVVVVGLGGVGMAALMAAVAVTGVSVVGVDSIAHKRDLARELGAVAAFTPHDALDTALLGDAVIEAAGNVPAFETAVLLTAPGGTTVTVGLPAPDARASISPLALVGGGRTIVGSYLGSAVPARDIPIFADMWRAGRLPIERLVSLTIALADINEAMDALASGEAMRQIIAFDAEGRLPP